MSRWQLNNLFREISHKQFVECTTKFKEAAELSFGTAAAVQITAYNSLDVKKPLWKIDKIEDVTPDLWRDALYVNVEITPIDFFKASRGSANAYIEFKKKEAQGHIYPKDHRALQILNALR